jgi:hypothetical protein
MNPYPIIRGKLYRMPLPETDAELEVLTYAYFGKALHLSVLSHYGRYEVKEDYNSYHGKGWKFSECNTDGYDYSGRFWCTVIGEVTCGGIARASYGAYKLQGWRQRKRIHRWIRNRKTGINYLRKPFLRLAEKTRFSERTE